MRDIVDVINGRKGGQARAKNMTAAARSQSARDAALARHAKWRQENPERAAEIARIKANRVPRKRVATAR